MPHYVNFDELVNPMSEVKTLEIDVVGWKRPLKIEYVYVDEGIPKMFWRVLGTTHTFTITLSELNSISGGDYVQHFQDALTAFRDDVMTWAAEGLKEKWMREYVYQFKTFIVF